MLSEEQILDNKKIFLEKNKEYNILSDELIDFLGESLFTAPASTSKDLFFAYPGGLISFILKSATNAIKINKLLKESIRHSNLSILRVIFISQIGKTFLFKFNTNEWQVKNLGKIYEFNNELLPIKYTERSLYYINKFNIKIEENELNAILNFENEENKNHKNSLIHISRMGFEISIINEKNNE